MASSLGDVHQPNLPLDPLLHQQRNQLRMLKRIERVIMNAKCFITQFVIPFSILYST